MNIHDLVWMEHSELDSLDLYVYLNPEANIPVSIYSLKKGNKYPR